MVLCDERRRAREQLRRAAGVRQESSRGGTHAQHTLGRGDHSITPHAAGSARTWPDAEGLRLAPARFRCPLARTSAPPSRATCTTSKRLSTSAPRRGGQAGGSSASAGSAGRRSTTRGSPRPSAVQMLHTHDHGAICGPVYRRRSAGAHTSDCRWASSSTRVVVVRPAPLRPPPLCDPARPLLVPTSIGHVRGSSRTRPRHVHRPTSPTARSSSTSTSGG